ncbi:MAG: hypothetical protein NVS3B20_12600 [Polyangiales bacterium]
MRLLIVGLAVAVAAGALSCSSGGQGSSASNSNGALDACNHGCDLQKSACPSADNSFCRSACSLVAYAKPECQQKYADYQQCQDAQGWDCPNAGFATPKNPTACKDKQDQYHACSRLPCVGEEAGGVCPSVACPCPGGMKNISSFTSDGAGHCTCLTATTCTTHC